MGGESALSKGEEEGEGRGRERMMERLSGKRQCICCTNGTGTERGMSRFRFAGQSKFTGNRNRDRNPQSFGYSAYVV
jgi:hypothetical protein